MEPTAAERIRTICIRAVAAQVVADGDPPAPCPVHHLLADGTLALSVAHHSPMASTAANTPAIVELLDRTPIPADAAVRALVWIRGRVHPVDGPECAAVLDAIAAVDPRPALLDVGHRDTLLLMDVEAFVFADATGAETVDRAAVLAARPDPFGGLEAAWVRHLQDHHPDMVERLRLHLPRGKRQGRIRLLGIDRYGVTVRTEGPQGNWDVRVPFFAPVNDQAGLSRAMRRLMGCPFANGLRPRSAG